MTEDLFDKSPCGYFCFSDDGNLIMVNQTLASILKFDKKNLTGKNVESIFTLPTRIFFQTHFFPMIRMHGHAEEIFISLLSSKGEHLPVLLNANRMVFEDQTITACAFIVVPNRKKFEDELVSAKKEAEKALKESTELMKAKSELKLHADKLEEQMRLVKSQNHEMKQFSHVVTHNLKEPLRKIMMYTGRLQTEISSPVMDKLIKSTDQMKLVVSGLQQYVWVNEKKTSFTVVDLNQTVNAAIDQLTKEVSSDLFELNADNLASLEGDAEQLQLLLYHLLSNAVKFRKSEKAHIQIHTTIVKQNTFQSLENRYNYDDFVKLEISDDGVGFDMTYREHSFELFRKLHYAEGLGLGLALCKKIVDNHHGKIEAESEVNLFTKIKVWLPAKRERGL